MNSTRGTFAEGFGGSDYDCIFKSFDNKLSLLDSKNTFTKAKPSLKL